MESILIQKWWFFRDRIKLGSIQIPTQDYPFYMFIIGTFIETIKDIDSLYEFIEYCCELKSKKQLSDPHIILLIKLLKQKPQHITFVIRLLEDFKENYQENYIVEQIQSLFEERPPRKLKQMNGKSTDTIVMDNLDHSEERRVESQFDERQQELRQFEIVDEIKQKEKSQQKIQKTNSIDAADMQLIKLLQKEDEEYAKQLKQGAKVTEEIPCEICYVELYEQAYSLLESCGDCFHSNCLIETFKESISENKFPLRCPNQQCKKELSEADIKAIMPIDLYEKYQERTLKSYADMNGDSISWCPTADCGYMFFFEKDDNQRFECLQCKKQYCLNCRVEWHKDMTCKQYKISSTTTESDKQFMAFVIGKKFKQCPKCKFWVQKNEGCDHMTCKCKFQFCYKCGGIYMKCECVQKAREEMERRREQAQIRKRKKDEKKRKVLQKSEAPPKPTRNKRK